jgi:hypothetical protein
VMRPALLDGLMQAGEGADVNHRRSFISSRLIWRWIEARLYQF